MNLSNMQIKDMVNIIDGKKMGRIIDVIIENGKIINFVVEEKKSIFNFFKTNPSFDIKWEEIIKIGEDVILVEMKHMIK